MFSPVCARILSIDPSIASLLETEPMSAFSASSAHRSAHAMKFSFFAVKSVSAFSSTIAAAEPSPATLIAIRPSPAARSVRFSILPL